MKFSKLSQLFLVSTIGLLVATLLTACQLVNIDYVFVAGSAGSGSSTGQIAIFATDATSGALRTGAKTAPSGGDSPVAMAASADYANLYVVNQGSSNNVVHLAIGGNGQLTQKDVVTGIGTPISVAVNAAGTFLYVTSISGSGPILTEFPISSAGAIGTAAETVSLVIPGYTSDTVIPTGVTVLANSGAVYVAAVDQSAYNPGGTASSTANPGWVFGYAVGTGGALTPTNGSPYKAGVKPSALTADPTNRFLYVTDFAQNQLIGYSIQSGSTLQFLLNGPFRTGSEPAAIVIDPRGKFIYIANALDSTVSAYSIDLSTGTPSAAVNVTGAASNGTDTQPVAILVEPALGRFVYTANHLGNSISGFRLDPTAGTLTATQATPYPTVSEPSAIVAVPHGNHSLQSVTP
jgi:6-phosphogluconolactonase (cycloisomerase 2 family)